MSSVFNKLAIKFLRMKNEIRIFAKDTDFYG